MLIVVNLSAAEARRLRQLVGDLAAGLRVNGAGLPPGLALLAVQLAGLPPHKIVTPGESAADRTRRLDRERSRRYRARRRGEPVPLRQPGRPKP